MITSLCWRIKGIFANRTILLFCALISIMKLLLIAALAVLALAQAEEEVSHDERYILFPDGEGVPHLVDLQEKYEAWSTIETFVNLNTVSFNLFTRNNPRNPQVLFHNGISTVIHSNFRNTRPTRFVTHGWRSNLNSPPCVHIRDAYLAAGDYNVIVVDWSSIAGLGYSAAQGNVRNVAGRVADFLNFLNQQAGLNFGTTQLAGHSLGGHLVSLAARFSRGTPQGVIALDPAGPGFESASVGNRVDSTDAANVQVIHTNAGGLGILRNVGDSDFFPNGGSSQPGCGLDFGGTCAHSRAYLFFAESITNQNAFRANENRNVHLGGRTLTTGRGRFTVTTNSNSPFGQG